MPTSFSPGWGSQASGAGAKVFRTTGSGTPGKMTKGLTASNEVRRDGQRSRGRHGIQKTSGVWGGQLALGAYDDILEAIVRGTYSAADLAITEATAGLTSITTTANTIVAAAGSWITAGVRVNDVWRLTNHSSAANNGNNLRVTGRHRVDPDGRRNAGGQRGGRYRVHADPAGPGADQSGGRRPGAALRDH